MIFLMAKINGTPFIYYLLDQVVRVGFKQIVISTGYLGHFIEESIGFSYKGLLVHYSREETPLGTAGALKLAGQILGTEQCLVMNGDSYTEFNPSSLLMVHNDKKASITLLVKAVDDISRFGTIKMNGKNEIVQFNEKRTKIIFNQKKYFHTKDDVFVWSKSELLKEINQCPERFSPNVFLRPLYQERIMNNMIYMGGPSEMEGNHSFRGPSSGWWLWFLGQRINK